MPTMTDLPTSLARMSVADLSEAIASSTPTPGGGSAAAVAAALGASLIAMVARLSLGRPKYEAHAALQADAVSSADRARSRLLQLADDDAAAYAAYRDARRLPHATEPEAAARQAASATAARAATSVPLATVQECHRLIEVAEQLVGRSNAAAASDLDVASLLLHAAARGAATNALVNLPAVGDEIFSAAVTSEVEERLLRIQASASRVHEQVGAAPAAVASA
jgi:formiminotetrahydrofolate cyclodeaminase